MGLEENADAGLDTDDLVNIFKGNIKDRYQVYSSNAYLLLYNFMQVVWLKMQGTDWFT